MKNFVNPIMATGATIMALDASGAPGLLPASSITAQGNPHKSYATKSLATADLANIPADALIYVNADSTAANNGFYTKTGGVLVQSSYDRVAALESSFNTVWDKHVNIAYAPGAGAVASIGSISTYTVTFSIPAGFYINGKDQYKAVPALSNLTLTNTQCCYLNITNLDAIVWSAASGVGNVKADKTKVIAVINFYGVLYSPIPSIQKLLDAAYAAIPVVMNERLVAPSGGDYTTITAALADITDNTAINQYRLFVSDGDYIESGSGGVGLVLKNYIHIAGAGRHRVSIKGPEAPAGSEGLYSTIHSVANCTVEGVGLIAYKNKYAVHIDGALQNGFILRDFKTIHYGGVDATVAGYDIGIGAHARDEILIENGECGGAGVYIHGVASGRVANTEWNVGLKNLSAKLLKVEDFLEYSKNSIDISGSKFESLVFLADPTHKNAYPANPLYDRGYYHQSVQLGTNNSSVGRIEYQDSFTIDTVLINPIIINGMNTVAINKGATVIAKGKAVKLLADANLPDTYPTDFYSSGNVDLYDGSGIFCGVAERDIAVDAKASVQHHGKPYIYVDATAAIAYGDDLEINSSGVFVKRSTGIIRANALESKASGTGLIKAKLI